MNEYLIPANSKKSQLILGFFTPFDLVVFGLGALITIVALLIIHSSDLGTMILILLPLVIFEETTVFDYDTLRQRIRELAFLNRGLKLSLTSPETGTERGVRVLSVSIDSIG